MHMRIFRKQQQQNLDFDYFKSSLFKNQRHEKYIKSEFYFNFQEFVLVDCKLSS